ncbi:hypothetical protein E1166_10600 [Micromonospora sp. KC213]|nr:hypothetical protein E1166_10600 [Micromonospora sp. KC213]
MAALKKYPDELRQRTVRLYRESEPKPVIWRLAEQFGVHHEALRNWIRQVETDRGDRTDRPTTDMIEESRRLRGRTRNCAASTRCSRRRARFSPRSATRRRS